MNPLPVVSLVALLVAAGWAVLLSLHVRSRGTWGFALLVFLFLLSQIPRLLDGAAREGTAPERLTSLLVLAAGVLANALLFLATVAHRRNERSRAERRRADDRMAKAQHAARFGTFHYDALLDECQWSPGVFELLGRPCPVAPEEGESAFALVHAEDRAAFRATLLECVKTGTSLRADFRMVRADGGDLFCHSVADVERDAGGRVGGLVGVVQDITLFRQTEAALRRSEQKYRAYVENAPHAIFVLDGEGRYHDVNQASCRMTGFTKEELLTMTFLDLIPRDEESQRLAVENFGRLRRKGENARELVLRRKDGTSFPASLHAVSLDSELSMAFCADVTVQKEAAEALLCSRQRHSLHVERTPLGVIEWNTDFRVVDWNPAAETIFGYSRAEALGKHAEELFAPEGERRRMRRSWEDLLAHHDGHRTSNQHRTKSGETVLCDWYNTPLVFEGTVLGVASLVQDVTPRAKAEEQRAELETQLRQAQKMEALGALAGGIAHDFNNILMAIMGSAELLSEDQEEAGQPSPHLVTIMTAAQRGARLVDRILAFGRKKEPVLRPTHLFEVVEESLQILRATLPASIEIRERIGHHIRPVLSDASQIQQVILNLGANAAQAMPDRSGVLEVVLREVEVSREQAARLDGITAGLHVMLSVLDDGEGMSPAVLERIFDPFFTTKEVGKGTGLGLSVVHGIVMSHGGAIRVDSEEGRGSAFRVYFPVCEDPGAERLPQIEFVPGGREHVLLVDDEEVLTDIGRRQLEKFGYRVSTCTSSCEALARVRARPTDYRVVITDMAMPGLSGLQLAQRLGELEPCPGIVLSTGSLDPGVRERAARLGVGEVIGKPFCGRDLARAVQGALRKAAPTP